MKTNNGENFKAVDFMWQVREELSQISQKGEAQFQQELKEAMQDF